MEGSVKRNSTEENPIPVLMTWHSYLFSYLDDGRARGGMWRVCDAVATAWRVLQISGWIQSTPSFDVTGTLLFVKGTIWILEEIYEFKLRIMIFSYLKTKILFIQKKWSEKSQICNYKPWCIAVEILIGKIACQVENCSTECDGHEEHQLYSYFTVHVTIGLAMDCIFDHNSAILHFN